MANTKTEETIEAYLLAHFAEAPAEAIAMIRQMLRDVALVARAEESADCAAIAYRELKPVAVKLLERAEGYLAEVRQRTSENLRTPTTDEPPSLVIR